MALTKIPGSLIDTASGINGLIYPSSDGTSGQFLTTDGSGTLSFATVTTYTDSDVETYLDGGTSTPTFATATVSGTLTVVGDLDLTGDINSYNVTDLDITDQTITLGAGQTEALSGGSGIIIDGSNASILWDETNDEFDFSHAINIPKLNVSDSSGTAYKALTVQSSNVNSDAGISLIGGGGSDFRLQQPYNSAGLFFYDVTNTAERMRIDSSGNVGIGVTPESWYTGGQMRALQVGGTTAVMSLFDTRSIFANNYYLKAGTGADTYINTDEATQYYQEAGNHIWKHATSGTADTTISWSESMRIDSNGTVLVGKTATTLSVAGVFIGASGSVGATRASDDCLTLNRTGNDGAIASFYKNGAPIGSIGTGNGGNLYIGSGDAGINFNADINSVYPINPTNGAASNGSIDLGASGIAFKDLYLSGTMLGNITKLRQHTSSMYVSPTNTNTLNGNLDADNDSGDMWINYRGYQDGFSRFRDFRIGNGKGAQLVLVSGSAASVAITGSLSVTSSFSKGSGSFKIDHPLEAKKDTHHLIHSFVEAPQADNIYRGKVDLVNGSATVNIDTVAGMTEGTFVALNREVQCFTTNESNWDAVKGSVSGNILTIESQNSESTATISWLVIGERQDSHMYDTEWTDDDGKVIVEPLKTNEE